ncbi:MAG: HAMP domain-containing sensor histidine kinase [Patescibacteria group bacterium]|nr:HAMP domain-containing sensor histidine kinase [Patescibacteria group bacterium]
MARIWRKLNVVRKLRDESLEYGMPICKLPDFILLVMGLANITVMIITYIWASGFADDPREAVFLVAGEAVIIMIIGNVFAESAKRMTEINKLRKEIVHIISHQMRSPLTTVKWQVEMFKRSDISKLSVKQIKYVDRIYEENEKLRTMISDILNMSRIERHADMLIITDVAVDESVHECIKMLESFAEIKKLNIDFKTPKVSHLVHADKDKLKIAFMNLIENAISYSREKGTVKISVKKQGQTVQVRIKDDGIGIDPSEHELVFHKFYRAENGRKTKPEGTGLGLFMSRKVIEQMKGTVKLNSRLGKGAEFCVTLPISKGKNKTL